MITHRVLATQQGYEQLLNILADGLRDKQDPFLLFFMNIVEPVYEALSKKNMQLLFDTLGVRRYPITTKAEKIKWRELECLLKQVRNERTIDVVKVVIDSKLIPIPPLVEDYYQLYNSAPETIYSADTKIQK